MEFRKCFRMHGPRFNKFIYNIHAKFTLKNDKRFTDIKILPQKLDPIK